MQRKQATANMSEHPSTYVIADRSSREDLVRLQIQDRLMTAGMGGVLPEQPNNALFHRVLDVGCGTGGWLIETATAYPEIELLVGVDISTHMVAFARAQAEAAGVSNRVEFQVMDALRMLEFPPAFFDLVNQRSGVSYLRIWEWHPLLREYQRVTRPGGIIRITEGEWGVQSTSPALTTLFDLLLQAFYRAGYSFSPARDGLTGELRHLLGRHGFRTIRTRSLTLTYQAGTPECQLFVEDLALTFRLLLPFLQKWIHVPDTYKHLYKQALDEMRQSDFAAQGTLLTVWGGV